jgi:8-oxo-dGTP pyrophosphatase MutT (NUDIX family)
MDAAACGHAAILLKLPRRIGAQDLGESVVEAAQREVREETGIDIEITGLSGIYSDPGT